MDYAKKPFRLVLVSKSVGVVLGVLVAGTLLSCVTPEQSDGPGRVVSKSSYVRPFWVGKSMSFDPSAKLGYASYRKDHVRILDLGIKQAQMEAAAQVVARFDETFARFVVDLVKKENPKIPAKEGSSAESWYSELRSLSLAVSRQFQAPVVSAESVYWEEVELVEVSAPAVAGAADAEAAPDLLREFRIYVQMGFDRGEITDRLSVLMQRLEAAEGGARFAGAIAVLGSQFSELRKPAEESTAERKEVESIQTEMDSAGSTLDSSVEQQGPRGRKYDPGNPESPAPQAEPEVQKSPPPPAKKKGKK